MLEKIGLPPKPSVRGNSWVVDASHCQGCSSQFSFINRKHHCRRCGGIFCGSCTQQRMVLRGQGDSPVRICEPCKKLEEAARFEMRYGHKSRTAKGGSKLASKKEEEMISSNDDKIFSAGSASCSYIQQITDQVEGDDILRSISLDQSTKIMTELESATPEDLRQQAVVEKTTYRTLKAEGKSEEALKAFKRGKELERQAAALEISLRKNRKRALSSNVDIDDTTSHQTKEKMKPSSTTRKSKDKDDLSAELKELGWSDLDLREAEKKPANLTVEGELSSLLREVSQKPNKEKKTVVSVNDKSHQVLAHKKKALELKRAGNVLEAKEELKRAKILERKIEEEELLGDDDGDESDDELSSLIRSMDADDDLSTKYKPDMDFDFNKFDDFGVDGNFEVTDQDLDDPEMASALESLGWSEDITHSDVSYSKRESLPTEIQSLKSEAVNQKRAGNTVDAMALLKKAKVLEMELHSLDTQESMQETLPSTREYVENTTVGPKIAPKSKLTIQKELLALKKKALALRREGKSDESEEELKKAKVLEEQLEDMNKAPTVAQPSAGNRRSHASARTPLGIEDVKEEEEVTDQDLHDPSYLSLLKNLGWEDEDNVELPTAPTKINNEKPTIISNETQTASDYMISSSSVKQSRKSKTEIQRELLALKRKALTLRRQGDTEAADEVLKNAMSLEAQLQEYDEPKQKLVSSENDAKFSPLIDVQENRIEDSHDSRDKVKLEKPEEIVNKNAKSSIQEQNTSEETAVPETHIVIITPQQEILAHKRKALSLKREGKLAEAKEELRLAKLLEKRLEAEAVNTSETSNTNTSTSDDLPSVEKKEASPTSVSKPMSSRGRFKLQQESLGHKRKALKLRREGKTAEADAEFELAKALESQLQEMDGQDLSKGPEPDNVTVEDFLDPQLLSALQSIGLGDGSTRSPQGVEKPESTKVNLDINSESANNTEREQLVERIKAEKVKAINLKRSGKQVEALDALRRAKLYEKKLQSLS